MLKFLLKASSNAAVYGLILLLEDVKLFSWYIHMKEMEELLCQAVGCHRLCCCSEDVPCGSKHVAIINTKQLVVVPV